MGAPTIPLFDLKISDEDLAAVEAVLRSDRLSEGEQVEAFEREFAEHLGVRHAVAVSNCTAALHLAYLAIGLGPGDEIIVPSITFAATAAAALYCGATPVFADSVGPTDIGIDPADVEARITARTKAVCAVHFAGYPAALHELRRICSAHDIALLEDCAHAPSADLDGRKLGAWGLAGCFSFFSNKVLAVGEGGLVSTDDDAVAAAARRLRSDPWSLRFDEPRAALIRSRMRRMEDDIVRRRELTLRYRRLLADVDGVIVPYRDEDVAHSSCYVMPVILSELERQGPVRAYMRDHHGVQTSLLYAAVHEFTAYRARYPDVSLPQAERIGRTEVTIPLYGFMTTDQQDRVVTALAEALERA